MNKDRWTTFNKDGSIGTPLGSQPVIIVKKGKRKINPLLIELLKSCPQEVKDRIEKAFTCKWLCNGDECSIKGLCEPEGFLCWDSEEVEASGSNGTHFLHQIFSKKQLFQTKNALCKHYIKMFEKFMDKEEE